MQTPERGADNGTALRTICVGSPDDTVTCDNIHDVLGKPTKVSV